MKNKVIIGLFIILSISIIINIRSFNHVKAEQLKDHNESARLILNLHNAIEREMAIFTTNYYEGRLDDVEVKAHHSRMLNLCKLKMGDGRFFGINHIKFIAPYEEADVDSDLIDRYEELQEYLFSIYLNMPSSTYDVEEEENDWEYLNRITRSDEYRDTINGIVGLDIVTN